MVSHQMCGVKTDPTTFGKYGLKAHARPCGCRIPCATVVVWSTAHAGPSYCLRSSLQDLQRSRRLHMLLGVYLVQPFQAESGPQWTAKAQQHGSGAHLPTSEDLGGLQIPWVACLLPVKTESIRRCRGVAKFQSPQRTGCGGMASGVGGQRQPADGSEQRC